MTLILLSVALGGALGAVLRYLLGSAVMDASAGGFPYGTLAVNVLGSLVMGFLFFYFGGRVSDDSILRPLIFVGILGGFTTFSAFSIETLALLNQGDYVRGGLNVILSVSLCIMAAALGMSMAKQL
ncbi:MAG: fluoride efflux transporter CrcB [Pseudomonadota bacterium]